MALSKQEYMKQMTARSIALIEQGWAQETSALDKDGLDVHPWDPHACQWCLSGAIQKAHDDLWNEHSKLPYHSPAHFMDEWCDANDRGMHPMGGGNEATIFVFNDEPHRTHEEVVQSLKNMQGDL